MKAQNILIVDSEIIRKSGYGQYSIRFEVSYNGTCQAVSFHSTDSQLFDEDEKTEEMLLNAVGGIDEILNVLNNN
jgi:hypothetical protein